MNNYYSILFTIILLFSCSNYAFNQELAPTTRIHNGDKVQLLANKNLRYLELTGTPYQRGYAHGTQLKEEIKEVIQLFKEDIRKNTNEDPNAFISKFLKLTDFKSEIQKQTPHLLEELRGISEGSGIDMETIFMHQLGDEYWFNTNDIMAHHCSSFGVNKQGNQPSMTAQNMDIPTFYHGFQTVIKIIDPDSDMEMMMLTIPGHLGITGMNNKSVSINCNTLMQLNYGKTGLPVTFIVRGVVEKNTQKEALQFLDDIKHASGQNFIIGGPENVHSMECSANTIAEYRPFEKSKYTYHTNHPMANTDYSISYVEYLKKNNVTIEEGLNQCLRIRSFRQRFTDNNQNITLEDIKDVLRARDTESPDVVSNSHTYASVIYILSDTPKFIIAPGQPHKTDYIEIKL